MNADKKKEVISCRPSKPFVVRFLAAVETLGVKDSDLAKLSMEYGFDRATKEIADKRRKEAQSLLKRTKRMSFEVALGQPLELEHKLAA